MFVNLYFFGHRHFEQKGVRLLDKMFYLKDPKADVAAERAKFADGNANAGGEDHGGDDHGGDAGPDGDAAASNRAYIFFFFNPQFKLITFMCTKCIHLCTLCADKSG